MVPTHGPALVKDQSKFLGPILCSTAKVISGRELLQASRMLLSAGLEPRNIEVRAK